MVERVEQLPDAGTFVGEIELEVETSNTENVQVHADSNEENDEPSSTDNVQVHAESDEENDEPWKDPNYEPSSSDSETELFSEEETTETTHQSADETRNAVIEPPPRKRAKNGKAESTKWKQNQNKILREKGQEYIGHEKSNNSSKKVIKAGRRLKERCTCKLKKTRQCEIFSEDDRKKIFEEIWQLQSWSVRKAHVASLLERRHIKTQSKGDPSRRKFSMFYFLKKDGAKKQVCKKMFLSTTSLGKWSVHNWSTENKTQEEDGDGAVNQQSDAPKRKSPHYARGEDARKFMREEFLEALPKLPSHYCRKSTDKLYLEQTIHSMANLYQLYVEKCEAENQTPLSNRRV